MLNHRHDRTSNIGWWRSHRGACPAHRPGWIVAHPATTRAAQFRDAGNRHLACGGHHPREDLSRMLKKSQFSPAQPRRAKTRLSPSGVLASLRGSTYPMRFLEVGNTGWAFPFAKPHCKGERPTRSAVCTSSASSLAAALLDDLFEHPASNSTSGLRYTRHRTLGLPQYLVPQAISQIIR